MNILVTGGAGYIGSHAVRMLLKEGYNPIVLDNLSTGYKASVPNEVKFYEASIHDQTFVRNVLKNEKIQAVMHFAAFSLVGESVEKPLMYYENNVEGTRALLDSMIKEGVMNIVFSSTAAVYGNQKVMPLTEKSPLNPGNPYGATKKAIEDMLHWLSQTTKLNYAVLRYFNVAGAYYDGSIGEAHDPETHLIPNIIKSMYQKNASFKLFGTDFDTVDGTAVRDYIHVEDLIDAHILALKHIVKNNTSDIFNLGSGSGYSVKQIVSAVEKVMDVTIKYEESPRRAGDPATLIASYDKINKVVGWSPKRNLETMIQSAAGFIKAGGYKKQ